MSSTDDNVRRHARVLSAFMTQAEAQGFANGGVVLDSADFLSRWQAQVSGLQLVDGYAALKTEPLPAAAAGHVATLRSNPLFAREYGATAEMRMVELAKVIACQWWVDTEVSSGVHGSNVQSQQPTLDELLTICLPTTVFSPTQVLTLPTGPNEVIVYSTNNTLHVKGPGVDLATGQITFAVATGANLMLVREHAGRFVLTNGYHRAWLLRSRGVEMVPAVVVPAASPEEIINAPGFIGKQMLFGPRPPLIDDFLDDKLALTTEVRAILKGVRVGAQVLTIPRLLF